MTCVKTCPEKNAIGFFLFSGKLPVRQTGLAVILILLFFLGVSMAKMSGNWQNKISKTEYLRYSMQTRLPWAQKGD
jgi:hypothetical protein